MKLKKYLKESLLRSALLFILSLAGTIFMTAAHAQSVDDVRWKSEEQVRQILGEPLSSTPPVGTHATYTLWKYENFTVAFANSRAFHLFDKNSLRRFALEEERPVSE